MRYRITVLIVTTLLAFRPESAAAEDGASYRAEVLRYLFECDPGALHHQLQDYFSASARDNEWSPRAEIRLLDWFASDSNNKIEVTCASDICAVDFLMSPHEFATEHRSVVREWVDNAHPGYLPEGLHFPRFDGSTRLFLFRSSFDPADL